jgi:hypothetical protein
VLERSDQEASMPRPSSWVSTTAAALGEELARIGLTVPTDRLEDLLTLPRTIAMPLPTLGATIAALAGANNGPDEPATAMSMISILGVLTREHDGDLPTVFVPEPLLMRAARLIEDTADLVHHGCPLPPDVAEDVRPHLQTTLSDDDARLRALIPDTGRRTGSGLWAVPDDPP